MTSLDVGAVLFIPHALQDLIVLLGPKGTLLAHGQLMSTKTSRSFSMELLSSRSAPTFVEFQKVPLCPSLHPVEVPQPLLTALSDQ